MSKRSKHIASRPPKTPGTRLLEGGKDAAAVVHDVVVPIVDAVADDEQFVPPHSLNLDGRQVWDAAIRTLRLVGELSKDHIPALTHLAHLYQRMMKKQAADQDIDWRDQDNFRKLLIEFGLTPASRMRMDPDGSKTRVLSKRANYNAAITSNAREVQRQEAENEPVSEDNPFSKFIPKSGRN